MPAKTSDNTSKPAPSINLKVIHTSQAFGLLLPQRSVHDVGRKEHLRAYVPKKVPKAWKQRSTSKPTCAAAVPQVLMQSGTEANSGRLQKHCEDMQAAIPSVPSIASCACNLCASMPSQCLSQNHIYWACTDCARRRGRNCEPRRTSCTQLH